MANITDPLLGNAHYSESQRARSNSAPPAPNQGREQYGPPVIGAAAAVTSALATGSASLPSGARAVSATLGLASGALWSGGAVMDQRSNPGNSNDDRARTVGNLASIGAGLGSSFASVASGSASLWGATTSSALWGVSSGVSMLRGAAATVSGLRSRDVWQSVSGAAQTLSGVANAGAAYMSYEAARHTANDDTTTASSYAYGSAGAWLAGEALGALSTWAATPSRRASAPDLESGLGSPSPALQRSHSHSSLPINVESPSASPVNARHSPRASAMSPELQHSRSNPSLPINVESPPASPVNARHSPRASSVRSDSSNSSHHAASAPIPPVQLAPPPVLSGASSQPTRARRHSMTALPKQSSAAPSPPRARSNSLGQ